jgi:hypothetical protein
MWNGFCSARPGHTGAWLHGSPTGTQRNLLLLLNAFSNSDSKHTRVLKEELFRGLPGTNLNLFLKKIF